jgi:hypothetical protein
VLLNLSNNTFVESIMLNTASVRQPRRVEDANLGKRLCIPTTFKNADIYHYALVACKFVQIR